MLAAGGLPILQGLLPQQKQQQGGRGRPQQGVMLPGHEGGAPPSVLAASLNATLNASLAEQMATMEGLSVELPEELLSGSGLGGIPEVADTPTQDEMMGLGPRRARSGGAGSSDGGGGGGGGALGLDPLPLSHSGVSNLLDGMDLCAPALGDSDAETTIRREGSVETLHSGQSLPTLPAGLAHFGVTRAMEGGGAPADRFVQVIAARAEPFTIVWASEAWLNLCEFEARQVLGQTLDVIRGPLTKTASMSHVNDALRHALPIAVRLINHTRTGRPFAHKMRVEPLQDSTGHVQCFQIMSSGVTMLSPAAAAAAAAAEMPGEKPTGERGRRKERKGSPEYDGDASISGSTTAETTDNGDAALRITLNLQGDGEAVSPAGSELGDALRLNEVLDMLDNAESPGVKKRPHDSPPEDATLVEAFLDGLTN